MTSLRRRRSRTMTQTMKMRYRDVAVVREKYLGNSEKMLETAVYIIERKA